MVGRFSCPARASACAIWGYKASKYVFARPKGAPRMDIDNFEWWYSEGEAPDEEWDEPLTSDESSDGADAEAAGDVTAESDDAASDPAEPLTFEQAWAQAEADEAKADATATLSQPADMSISPAKTPQPRHNIDPGSTASFSILDVPAQGAQAPAPTHRPDLAHEEDAGRRSPLGPILIAFMAGVIACSAIGNVWGHVEQQRKDAAKAEMSIEQSLSRTRSVHVSVEVKDGATWDTARGDSQMLIHIVGRTLKGQTVDEYSYVNSDGDGIELKPGDYELTVDEPPVATDGTRFRASKRMVPVSFNSQAPNTVDSTPQGGFDLYVIAQ